MRLKVLLSIAVFIAASPLFAQKVDPSRITTNPLNLNYRFQTDGVYRRETADPVIILFKDRYYLFASHSSGYWHSPDLKNWTFIPTKTLKAVEVWAPAVFVYKDAIYYMGMGEKRIYKSTHPEQDQWEEVESKATGYGDPAFFQDNDGRVYIYYGCSDNAPIKGFEVDPEDGFKAISPEIDLIPHNAARLGWEVFGERNEVTDKRGWNEAPCISRHGDFYYLQYAAPGTEFTSYCTGVYVSKNPLGPYSCMEGAPFSIKPGGFITGAGHGHPFKDRYGNDWYVGTMIVAAKEHFERRVGIFPAFYQDGYAHATTEYADFPFIIPDKKTDFSKKNLSTGMNLLSYGKSMKASSCYSTCTAEKATDENIKTWWSAASGQKGEWLEMDLGKKMKISALQICFADEGFTARRHDENIPVYQYVVECSADGKMWKTLTNRSNNAQDQIYELIVLDKEAETQFVRVKNSKDFAVGRFSIADMRLFGNADYKKPEQVSDFKTERQKDRRRIAFSWQAQTPTTGYIIRWGATQKRIDHAAMVYGNQAEFGFFDRDIPYYVTIEAFNESGKGKSGKPLKIQ